MKITDVKLIHSAITFFVGELVLDVRKTTDNTFSFCTQTGIFGYSNITEEGNCQLIIGDEVVYEMEESLLGIFEFDFNDDIYSLYDYITEKVLMQPIKHRSHIYANMVLASLQKILGMDIAPNNQSNSQEAIVLGNTLHKICLN